MPPFNANFTNPADTLVPGITPAQLCPFIDYNINTELNKFKTANGNVIHNGGAVDNGLLNEKWESIALVPVNNDQGKGRDEKDEYYLISVSDNDFITNNGMFVFFVPNPIPWLTGETFRVYQLWKDTVCRC